MTPLREISQCEVCQNNRLTPVLNLGRHPICDDLIPIGDSRVCQEYPIEILFCEKCFTAHHRYQLPQRDLFPKSYHYRSRFTADVLEGMTELVDSCERRFGSLTGKTVLDIGCNDGSLLDFFRAKGAVTLGIEPTAAARDAMAKGHITFEEYLTEELANKIVSAHGRPDFITFTNVFAHIEDLGEVISSLKCLLGERSIVVIENHYLGAVLDGNQFDTFYHEHARTYSCASFFPIAEALGVRVLQVDFPARYGGNIRVFLGSVDHEALELRDLDLDEKALGEKFRQLQGKVDLWRERKTAFIKEQIQRNGQLRAKAFPARAAILIKLLGLDEESISAVYEKAGSLKIGHYVPGTRIPIRSEEELTALADYAGPLLNLAWHIPREIRSYLTAQGYHGPVVDIVSEKDFLPGRVA